MRNPSVYLKMRVLGAVDTAVGNTERERFKAVSQMTFTDENGYTRQFTWATISTWRSTRCSPGLRPTISMPKSRPISSWR